ncbi:MAG: helix-hairpin-helix domain-containing protein, partial [Calditrichaeota bacterium]
MASGAQRGRGIWIIVLSCLLVFSTGIQGQSEQPQVAPGAYSPQHQLDLNNASYEEIARLPIPAELAERIYERIDRQGPFTSVYQLLDIEGMTVPLFLKIKPLVRIEPYMPQSEREERIENLYFRLERWEGNEGT